MHNHRSRMVSQLRAICRSASDRCAASVCRIQLREQLADTADLRLMPKPRHSLSLLDLSGGKPCHAGESDDVTALSRYTLLQPLCGRKCTQNGDNGLLMNSASFGHASMRVTLPPLRPPYCFHCQPSSVVGSPLRANVLQADLTR